MVWKSRLGFYYQVLKVSRPVLLLHVRVKCTIVCHVVFVSVRHV